LLAGAACGGEACESGDRSSGSHELPVAAKLDRTKRDRFPSGYGSGVEVDRNAINQLRPHAFQEDGSLPGLALFASQLRKMVPGVKILKH